MDKTVTLVDVIAGMIVSFALFLVGVFFILTGVSFLPVIGIFVGIAIIGLAFRFSSHLLGVAKERLVLTRSEKHASCPLPPVSTID